MHRSRQDRHLRDAGLGHPRRCLGPRCERRKLFLHPPGDQRHVDAARGQRRAQFGGGNGAGAAVVLLQDNCPAIAQRRSVDVGHVIMVRVARQETLQRRQRGRPRIIQRHLDVQPLQRGHGRVGQACAGGSRLRQQRPCVRDLQRQRGGRKHQHVQRVFLCLLCIIRRRLAGRLTHHSHHSVDEISQRRVVHQFPRQ